MRSGQLLRILIIMLLERNIVVYLMWFDDMCAGQFGFRYDANMTYSWHVLRGTMRVRTELVEKENDDMRYVWIDEYLLSKTGVTKDLQKDWNWIRYKIGGKMFAAICLDRNDEPYYITLKLEPVEGDFLRQQYEDIIPGYYANKMHWNSIKPDGEVPDDLLKDLLDKSYQLVLGGFSKKKQQEILEGKKHGV